jgi:2-polyprenyl-3-methyl-5-hydroxy-6-metoxy-1,4-benzoquinol methylase
VKQDPALLPNPLSAGSGTRIIARIPVESIIRAYREQLNVDVSTYFEGLETLIQAECDQTGYRFFMPDETAGDGAFYESLQHFEWYYVPWKWEHRQALKHIRKTDTVLEIGCGRGDFLNRLKLAGQKEVMGLEMNQAAAAFARDTHGLAVFSGSLSEFMGSENRQFDVICTFQVLEHIAEAGAFLRQALQLLKPGGVLIIGVPNYDAVIVKDEPNNILDYPPHHMGWWNARSLEKLCRIFPLELVSIEKETIPKERLSRYYFIRINNLRKRFGVLGRILDKLMYPVSVPLLSLFRKWIPGHTILAVYGKR